MPLKTEKDSMISKEILDLLEESFEKVHGQFLDGGTSLLETVAGLSAEEASRKRSAIAETIAGHVNHIIFYIVVLQEYITDKRSGKTDWSESWRVKNASETEWVELKTKQRNEYGRLKDFVSGIGAWDSGDYVGGVIAIIAHTAYHLGAIRQLMLI
jgi:hypothetical protein